MDIRSEVVANTIEKYTTCNDYNNFDNCNNYTLLQNLNMNSSSNSDSDSDSGIHSHPNASASHSHTIGDFHSHDVNTCQSKPCKPGNYSWYPGLINKSLLPIGTSLVPYIHKDDSQ